MYSILFKHRKQLWVFIYFTLPCIHPWRASSRTWRRRRSRASSGIQPPPGGQALSPAMCASKMVRQLFVCRGIDMYIGYIVSISADQNNFRGTAGRLQQSFFSSLCKQKLLHELLMTMKLYLCRTNWRRKKINRLFS